MPSLKSMASRLELLSEQSPLPSEPTKYAQASINLERIKRLRLPGDRFKAIMSLRYIPLNDDQISSQWVPCGRRAGLTMTGIILMDDGNFETAAERMSHEFVYLECGMFLALPELLRSNIGREILRESLGLEQDILSGWLNLTPFHLNEDGLDFRLRRVGGNYVVSPFGSVSGYSTTGEELIGTGAGCMLWEKTPTEGQYDLEDHTTLGRFSVDSSDGHATEGQNNSEDHTTLSRFSVDSSDGHATWTRWLYKWCLPCLGSCRG